MTIGQELLQELTLEATVTRRFLDSVPFDKLDYKPTEKSETLGRLAIHVAEIIAWWTSCIDNDKLDFLDFEPKDIKTKDELLSYFDNLLAGAKSSLTNAKDEEFEKVFVNSSVAQLAECLLVFRELVKRAQAERGGDAFLNGDVPEHTIDWAKKEFARIDELAVFGEAMWEDALSQCSSKE